MSNKVLIIYNSVDFFIPYIENTKGICVDSLYKKKSSLLTLVKKVCIQVGFFHKLWYSNWVNDLDSYSTIIIFSTTDATFIRWIKKNYPSIRLIFWYWNPVYRVGKPARRLFSYAEIWSFDKKDCEKFSMKFNSTFYFSDIILPKRDIAHDIVFLGIDKGRREELEVIQESFTKQDLKSYFHIVPDKKDYKKYNDRPIKYKEYLEIIATSRAILDIKPSNQDGLTLRPMESIFFKKKLITTDTNICKEVFYNKDNIFILGVDDLECLNEFLIRPYTELNPDYVKYFDFPNWLKRFENA